MYNGNIIPRGQEGYAVWKYVDFFDWDEEIKSLTQWKLVIPQQTQVLIRPFELYIIQHENNLWKINGNLVTFYEGNII